MPTTYSVACCLPNGTCASIVSALPGGADPIITCLSMGGVPRGSATICGGCDLCEAYEDPGSPFYLCSGSTGFCTACGSAECLHDDICEVLNYYQCTNPQEPQTPGQHNPGIPNCPVTPFIQAHLLPLIGRAFPYRHGFLAANKGRKIDGSTFYRKHAFDFLWWNNGGLDNQRFNQIGRVVLERIYGCKDADGKLIANVTDANQCAANSGTWTWTGRIMQRPSANFIVPDYEDCNKHPGHPSWRKNKHLLGFWFPKQSFCVDSTTKLLKPQFTTQSQCEQAGYAWQTPGNIIRPPQWTGAYRSASGGAHEPSYQVMSVSYDYVGANEYTWMAYLPVLPPEVYDPNCCANPFAPCVPYCNDPQAPSKFPLYDVRTYEMPCYTRDFSPDEVNVVSGAPYVNNRKLGAGQSTIVQAGLRGMVGHSPGDAEICNLRVYCDLPTPNGCPRYVGCDYDYCMDATENVTRKFTAYTDQRKYVWTADPLNRGWWVSYWAKMNAWFAQDSYWMALIPQRAPQRWTTWYEGSIEARWEGDTSVPEFNDFILSHDSGYGIDFKPKYSACNDVFMHNYGLRYALADSVYPPTTAQLGCKDPDAPGGTGQPPCLRAGYGYSQWYKTDYGAPTPEQMLIHETQRKRYTNPLKTAYATQYGWARIGFATFQPYLQV